MGYEHGPNHRSNERTWLRDSCNSESDKVAFKSRIEDKPVVAGDKLYIAEAVRPTSKSSRRAELNRLVEFENVSCLIERAVGTARSDIGTHVGEVANGGIKVGRETLAIGGTYPVVDLWHLPTERRLGAAMRFRDSDIAFARQLAFDPSGRSLRAVVYKEQLGARYFTTLSTSYSPIESDGQHNSHR